MEVEQHEATGYAPSRIAGRHWLIPIKICDVIGSTQSSINRYENGQATPTVDLLRKYADYFDVSMDYIFARCDDPHGKLYEAKPPVDANNPELRKFVEMCFDPESPMNEKLKEAMLKMLGEART